MCSTHGMRHGLVLLLVVSTLALPPAVALAAAESSESLMVLEDFEGARSKGNGPHLSHWRWSEGQKKDAKATTSLSVSPLSGASGQGLKLLVESPLPRNPEFVTLWHTGADYLPPTTQALRLRAKVVSGSFTLTCGSATAYFACSDVWAKPVVLQPGDWTTLEFSLVSNLERNFRRAIFSSGSESIHLTRWIQEPLRIMIGSSSQGELWIDDLEIVGRPEPISRPAQVEVLGTANLKSAFTFATDEKEFDLSRGHQSEPLRKPALLQWPESAKSLTARLRGLEEMSFIGVPLTASPQANGFRITGRITHESHIPNVVVDFLALVTPDGIFPWKVEKANDKEFALCLAPARTIGKSWGFYHTRRLVPNGKTVTLDLPFSDFLCAYGQEDLLVQHRMQQPLSASQIVALAFTSPFGQRSADTVFTIDSLECIRIEGEPALTYPQPSR